MVVPSTIPARYRAERRTPKATPLPVRLMVAGPGLPMIASDVSTRAASDDQRMDDIGLHLD